jgi:uncharacterized protein
MNTATCPICGRALAGEGRIAPSYAPFCSDRCRLIDLGRWLGETYRIPDADTAPDAVPGEDDEVP